MRMCTRNNRILILALITAAVMMLTGCTTFDNFERTFLDRDQSSDNVIYIGVYEPQSGSMSAVGQEEIKGIELAHSIYGNVKGARVELVEVDTQTETGSSKAAIQNMIKMKPSVIIGSAGEASSMIASPYIRKAEIPTITPSATNPLITQDNPYYFRACITPYQNGSGLAEYAYNELKSRHIAVVTLENDSTQDSLRDGFRSRIRSLSGNTTSIVMDQKIPVEQTGMKKLVTEIKESGADVVFMPVGLEKADLIFSQAEKQGLTGVTFLGSQSWDTDNLLALQKKYPDIHMAFASDRVTYEDKNTTDTVTAETQRFLIEYANEYGSKETPSTNAVLGYDAYLLAINAINNAKSLKTTDIRDALAATNNLRCATGVFTFDDNGNPVRTVNIATVKDGSIVSAYVTESSSKAESVKKIEK